MNKNESIESEIIQTTSERAVALTDHTTNNTDIESLDKQVKSMVIFSDNAAPYKNAGRARICKVCGKEGSFGDIIKHIQANHITGISISCDLCGKSFKSRNSVTTHKHVYHKNDK